ncbi:MAG: hypothetical protein VYB73_05375 [Verrucomicrobiota bacterium]|nr:hypothetical protein [Verrucomicrobiota bacterium]
MKPFKGLAFSIIILAGLIGIVLHAAVKSSSDRIVNRYADCHVHLLDFLQNGEFLNSDKKFPGGVYGKQSNNGRYVSLPFGERGRRVEALLESMDEAHVDNALVCGMPFIKKWSQNEPFQRPRYYLDSPSRVKPARDTDVSVGSAILDYKIKYADDPAKLSRLKAIHPSLCGFDATDLGAVDLLIKRIKEFPDVWECIGEVMSRHDDLTNLTTGERPRANHPALARVCRFAGEHFLPVSIHHNIAPISRNSNEVKLPTYLNEFIELIEYCRAGKGGCEVSTNFIWCHSGISRRIVIDDLHFWVEEVLKEYSDQLYIDLSWVVLDDYVLPNLESWVKLISRYPDRFMIGSDVVGTVSKMNQALKPYDKLLVALPEQIRDKVAHDNFANLFERMSLLRKKNGFGDGGIKISPDYVYSDKLHVRPDFMNSKFMEKRIELLNGE